MIKNLLPFLLAVSAFAQTATITDTIYTPFGGTFGGTVTVSLNSPALAQPLYSGNVTLSGWTQTVTVTAGAFTLTLYTNDLITPGGTSYTATFAPNAGSSWKETWIVPTGATTIREIRSTTVPSPSVRFTPSQITQAGATLNQVLRWNGSTWAPATAVGGGSGTVTSVSVTTANGVSGTVANPTTTPAITLSLGAITPSSIAASGTVSGSNLSGTNTGDQTNITGNAGTATALAADPANCSAGTLPRGVDASGVGQGCAAVSLTSEVTGTLPNGNTTATSLNTASAIVARDASGNFTAGTVTAALTGNASTATALAANPTDCAAGQYATTIAASGNLTCAAVAYSQVTGTPSLATVATSGSASDLTSGVLAAARGGAGTVSGILQANGTGTVSAAAAGTDYVIPSGNVATATALAVDPTACSAGQFVSDIAANGTLTCATPSGGGGSGTVTSVSISTGLFSVANPTTTPAISIAGTSGGVPYFSNGTTLASSAALDAGAVVVGGGAGGAPTVLANSSVPNAGELRIGTTPTPGATRSVFTLGSAITGGGTGANAGTFYALNAPSGFVGDFIRFELNGAAAFAVNRLGTMTVGTANTFGSSGVSVTNVGTLAYANASSGASAATRITGSAGTGSGNFLALRPTSGGTGADVLRVNADQRGVMIGQTAETSSISNLSLGVFDDTASSGVTRAVVQMAANQGTTSPFEVRGFNATLGDGALVFEVESDGSFRSLPTGTKPTCASGIRGTYWYTQGGTGVKDDVEVCTKDAANAYAWRVIY